VDFVNQDEQVQNFWYLERSTDRGRQALWFYGLSRFSNGTIEMLTTDNHQGSSCMRPQTRKLIPAAIGALTILLACPLLQANSTITLTGQVNWSYDGINVGPYLATIDGTTNLLVYCLDAHIDTYPGKQYSGLLTHPATEVEEEAAFLAAYSLTIGAPSGDPNVIKSVEGPISMAIWQLMGTLGSTPQDPKAQPYVALAQSAFIQGLITAPFLSSINIWSPGPGVTAQRFITAATPEPGTLVFMGTGVLLIALGRIRRRR